eukprot:4724526-Pyramimonas_sp.AAC.1
MDHQPPGQRQAQMGYRSAPSAILPHLRDWRQLGHCSASRGRSTSGEINLHSCNITSWNEVALNFCQELRPISDGFSLQRRIFGREL